MCILAAEHIFTPIFQSDQKAIGRFAIISEILAEVFLLEPAVPHPKNPPLPHILIAPIVGEQSLTSDTSLRGIFLFFNGLATVIEFLSTETDIGMKNSVERISARNTAVRIHTATSLSD